MFQYLFIEEEKVQNKTWIVYLILWNIIIYSINNTNNAGLFNFQNQIIFILFLFYFWSKYKNQYTNQNTKTNQNSQQSLLKYEPALFPAV